MMDLNNLSREQRLELSRKTEVLEKVKQLVIPDGRDQFITTEELSEYYEVSVVLIRQHVKDHRSELNEAGYRVITGLELTDLRSNFPTSVRARAALGTFPRSAVVMFSMFLYSSPVAQAIRAWLIGLDAAYHTGTLPVVTSNFSTQPSAQTLMLQEAAKNSARLDFLLVEKDRVESEIISLQHKLNKWNIS